MSAVANRLLEAIRTSNGTASPALERVVEELSAQSCMSDKAILRAMEQKRIFIDPFNPPNLATSSYDVTLGRHFYREAKHDSQASDIYNMYDQDDVRRVWGDETTPWQTAIRHDEWCMKHRQPALRNIPPDAEIIWLGPRETILAHTNEFIGGCDDRITTMMKARSSTGRNFIAVCKCAGWGDVSYHNRWTMEITNQSERHRIPLIVGFRIAQIIFFETEGVKDSRYLDSGKYQSGEGEEMKRNWKPWMMLPRMYNDREIRALNESKK